MRLSLGASRGRVVRQLMTEGLLIAVLGGRRGTGSSLWRRCASAQSPFSGRSAVLDHRARSRRAARSRPARVRLRAGGLAAITTLVFALVPALHATRLSLTHALRAPCWRRGARVDAPSALVISQVTVSLVLLVAAATLVRNGTAVGASGLGFETRHVTSVKPWKQAADYLARAAEALHADPRVRRHRGDERQSPVGACREDAPGFGAGWRGRRHVVQVVSTEFFPVLRIPIVHGRNFTQAEASTEAPVVIVSAAGARALWPGANPAWQDAEGPRGSAGGAGRRTSCRRHRYDGGPDLRRRRRGRRRRCRQRPDDGRRRSVASLPADERGEPSGGAPAGARTRRRGASRRRRAGNRAAGAQRTRSPSRRCRSTTSARCRCFRS